MELIQGFELMYRDSGNTIDFSFFMQIFPPSLKITVLKQNTEREIEFFP